MEKHMIQKFKFGDLVRIAEYLGDYMSHFDKDCEAIIMGSYNDKYGGGDIHNYAVYLKGQGEVSWYEEHQLTLIEPTRLDILSSWQQQLAEDDEIKADLDWIFANGEEVFQNEYHASVAALAACYGVTDLWGVNSEGITYYFNTEVTLVASKPFLLTGDLDGWLRYCSQQGEGND